MNKLVYDKDRHRYVTNRTFLRTHRDTPRPSQPLLGYLHDVAYGEKLLNHQTLSTLTNRVADTGVLLSGIQFLRETVAETRANDTTEPEWEAELLYAIHRIQIRLTGLPYHQKPQYSISIG